MLGEYYKEKIRILVDKLILSGGTPEEVVDLVRDELGKIYFHSPGIICIDSFFPYGPGVCRSFVLGYSQGKPLESLIAAFHIEEKYDLFFKLLVVQIPNICSLEKFVISFQ